MTLSTSFFLNESESTLGAEDLNVLIIGGGLAGLSTAKALENIGLKPTVIERREAYKDEGAGIAIPANGSWALKALGISIEETALHISTMTFMTPQGDVLATEDVTKIHPQGAQFYAIDRTHLLSVLKESLVTTNVQMGTWVTDIKAHEAQVDVCFSNKSAGTFDFVIIADGIHSKTRELIDSAYSADYDQPNYGAQYLGTQIWRTIIPTPPNLNNPVYMLGTDKVFLLYPINGAKTYVYAHHVRDRKGKDPDPENHIATVRDLFQEFGARAPEALEVIQKLTPSVLSHYLETSRDVSWSQGPRVLFAGDASRGFSPMLQNGAAQAFEDAYVLGELFKSRDNPETLAARYQERRGNRAAWVKQTSDTRIAALSEETMALRDAAIREKGAPNVSAFRILMQKNP